MHFQSPTREAPLDLFTWKRTPKRYWLHHKVSVFIRYLQDGDSESELRSKEEDQHLKA